MNREQALEDFLKSLRVSLTNSSMYFKEHPMFISSAENLRSKIYEVFSFIKPLKIGITPKSLLVEGKYLEKDRLYLELAETFHRRKVKNIEIKDGVTTEEVVDFLAIAASPAKDILKKGGMEFLLSKVNVSHILVEELDYSELLKASGQVCKDIWAALLGEALGKGNLQEINGLAENFNKTVHQFSAKDFIEDEEINTETANFLNYLKKHAKDKFYKCSKSIAKRFLIDKELIVPQDMSKMKPFVSDLDEEALSVLLYEELEGNDSFDALGFQLFSKLFVDKNHELIASSLASKLAANIKDKPHLAKKVKDLFSSPQDTATTNIYRKTLLKFIEEPTPAQGFSFDHELLHKSYRSLLINILAIEKNKKQIEFICAKIAQDLDKVEVAANIEYLKDLLRALKIQRDDFPSPGAACQGLEKKINSIIEKALIEGQNLADTEYFVDLIKESSFDLDFYLNKIFIEKKLNPYALRLFFKFFLYGFDIFCKNVKKHLLDVNFMKAILENIKTVDSLLALDILKHIFSFSDSFMKIEVIKAMQEISFMDKDFLFNIIQKGDFFLKKEALLVLSRDSFCLKQALKMLLAIANPFGLRNKLLMENLRVVEEAGIKDIDGYLYKLSRRGFFWHNAVRKYAGDILARINHGNS